MSTKRQYPQEEKRSALVLQCLFASVATLSPTVGEVVKFVNTHGDELITTFQCNKALNDLYDRGYVTKKAERHGKKVWTRWSINPSGALSLMTRTKFLPKHIRDFMDALNSRVAAASNAIIQDYFEQGVK